CIALGPLQDLSYFECQALRSIGAMGSDRFAAEPGLACRPFDRDRDGFIFGECSAAIVLTRSDNPAAARNYGSIAAAVHLADGNRGPDPSLAGEVRAIRLALSQAGLDAAAIDYVNPHGTGSALGDDTEIAALREAGLAHARINATKSVIGHGPSAPGAGEMAALLVQMQAGRPHPPRNHE